MKINKTLWRPDTCDCRVTFAWDSDLPAEQRVHTLVPEETVECDIHAGTPDVYEAVLAENQNKNRTRTELLAAIPAKYKRLNDNDEDEFINEPAFSFDAQRKVRFELPTLTKAERLSLESSLSNPDVKLL